MIIDIFKVLIILTSLGLGFLVYEMKTFYLNDFTRSSPYLLNLQ